MAITNELQLTGADVVEHPVESKAALAGGLLDGRVQSQDIDGLLDVEFCDADSTGVIIGELLELGFVLAAELTDGVEPGLEVD